jgi:hypothetical protein
MGRDPARIVVAYAEPNLLADSSAKRLGDDRSTSAFANRHGAKTAFDQVDAHRSRGARQSWALLLRPLFCLKQKDRKRMNRTKPAARPSVGKRKS